MDRYWQRRDSHLYNISTGKERGRGSGSGRGCGSVGRRGRGRGRAIRSGSGKEEAFLLETFPLFYNISHLSSLHQSILSLLNSITHLDSIHFNDLWSFFLFSEQSPFFLMLLSSKAGGVGLTLTGGSRLILLEVRYTSYGIWHKPYVVRHILYGIRHTVQIFRYTTYGTIYSA